MDILLQLILFEGHFILITWIIKTTFFFFKGVVHSTK